MSAQVPYSGPTLAEQRESVGAVQRAVRAVRDAVTALTLANECLCMAMPVDSLACVIRREEAVSRLSAASCALLAAMERAAACHALPAEVAS